MNKIPYNKAKDLIQEGDVLLFRPEPRKKWWYPPKLGWFIAKYSGGQHSHVGLASRQFNGEVVLIEFREWRGGRAINLANEILGKSGFIDVYRVISPVGMPVTDADGNESIVQKKFTDSVARQVTDEMFRLTGLPYGWEIIWKIALAYLPGVRLFGWKNKFENNVEDNIYVCSTAINYVFRKYYMDPVPGIADSYTKPADLAHSPLFQYQFTLV